MSLWRRIARLLTQSRIRLPRASLGAESLRPGDWIQIASRTWRVESRRIHATEVVFRLRSVDGGSGAVLVTAATPGGWWTLEHGGTTTSFPPGLLVVFPVGVP